jgi:hypothetical protein
METKFRRVAANICRSSVLYLLNVTLLTRSTSRWLIDFWKIFSPLSWKYSLWWIGRHLEGNGRGLIAVVTPCLPEYTEENMKRFSLKAVFLTGFRTRHLPNIIPEPYRHTNLPGSCISVVCEQQYITVWRRMSEFAANTDVSKVTIYFEK